MMVVATCGTVNHDICVAGAHHLGAPGNVGHTTRSNVDNPASPRLNKSRHPRHTETQPNIRLNLNSASPVGDFATTSMLEAEQLNQDDNAAADDVSTSDSASGEPKHPKLASPEGMPKGLASHKMRAHGHREPVAGVLEPGLKECQSCKRVFGNHRQLLVHAHYRAKTCRDFLLGPQVVPGGHAGC